MNAESQKIENALNLALDATEEERQKSLDLGVGYDVQQKTWEIIVKYSGDIKSIETDGITVVELLNEYAILTIEEDKISMISSLPQIEYIEKPKSLYFQRLNGKRASGITQVQNTFSSTMNEAGLRGQGVLVGIVDSGIDYMNQEFRTQQGLTRIVAIWDQSIPGAPPAGYNIGTEYGEAEINEAIIERTNSISSQMSSVPSQDTSGHGTAVAGIAVGNGGVASDAGIIVVKLGVPKAGGFPRTIELMQGVDYLVRKALQERKPMAINISIGNTYGAHDGSSMLETYLADISNYWKTTICIGSGNEGNAAGHVNGKLKDNEVSMEELAVASRELTLNLQIWKYYEDVIEISLLSPTGEVVGPIREELGTQRYVTGNTELLIYYGEPSPSSIMQEIYIEFLPQQTYVDSGVWTVELTPIQIVTGEYSMWLPSNGVLNIGTNFLRAKSIMTITVPATSNKVIAVGAYNSLTKVYADFSGRGGLTTPRLVKPDLVAPGVNIRTTGLNNSEVVVSGTSFATPFVTGSTAILMEYGIVKNNDPYLYGEKVKAYLRRGAQEMLGEEIYPNNTVGYGKLDIFNTFENIRRL